MGKVSLRGLEKNPGEPVSFIMGANLRKDPGTNHGPPAGQSKKGKARRRRKGG
jgi:hypothetical protein